VREKRLLTADQLRAILSAVGDRAKFIILILFGVGLRISEALGLKWSEIDFDRGELSVRRRWYRGDLGDEGETKSEPSFRVAPAWPFD